MVESAGDRGPALRRRALGLYDSEGGKYLSWGPVASSTWASIFPSPGNGESSWRSWRTTSGSAAWRPSKHSGSRFAGSRTTLFASGPGRSSGASGDRTVDRGSRARGSRSGPRASVCPRRGGGPRSAIGRRRRRKVRPRSRPVFRRTGGSGRSSRRSGRTFCSSRARRRRRARPFLRARGPRLPGGPGSRPSRPRR